MTIEVSHQNHHDEVEALKMMQLKYDGIGTYTFSNGDEFEGIFVVNKLMGIGRYKRKNGMQEYGIFEKLEPSMTHRTIFQNYNGVAGFPPEELPVLIEPKSEAFF